VRQEAVEARLTGQLGMEGGREHVALPDGHDPAVVEARQDVHVGTGPLDDRRPDEDRMDGLVAEDRH
jgi:hypothetical protein